MLKNSFFSPFFAVTLLALTVTSCACTDHRKPEANKNDDYQNKDVAALDTIAPRTNKVTEAKAIIKSFKGNEVNGKVTFTKVPGGIQVIADIDGLTPGEHGFHIHEFGDCKNETTVGAHFNPTNSKHGGPDSPERHVGDLGNLIANARGHAHYERVDKIISFEGEKSILGRSIVVHADRDDYTTQPTGASGDKIACGIINP